MAHSTSSRTIRPSRSAGSNLLPHLVAAATIGLTTVYGAPAAAFLLKRGIHSEYDYRRARVHIQPSIPGAHLEGVREHGTGVVSFSQAIPQLSPEDLEREVPVGAKRGDVIAHHCLVVHRAEANRSRTQHRRTIGYSYCSVNIEAITGGEANKKQLGASVGDELVRPEETARTVYGRPD